MREAVYIEGCQRFVETLYPLYANANPIQVWFASAITTCSWRYATQIG